MTITSTSSRTGWIRPEDARLPDLLAVLSDRTELADYPHATRVEQQVLVYDWSTLRHTAADDARRADVQAELARALSDGPGIVVLAGAFDAAPLDRATAAFERMIAEQRASGTAAGDHFAKPGANDRIWNALEKLALRDPDAFVEYYGNEIIELASSAWLGPFFQITSQVNVVNPGGAAQVPHRDYHLGFTSIEVAEQFPAHAHRLSAVLTLQGAIAHTDMPVESGPTMYLPHSQKYELGYLGWRRPDFAEYFAGHHVQLPLTKGDAGFFNPAVSHAAGHNRTSDVKRMANLLQLNSAFGRPIETVNREAVSNALLPALVRSARSGTPEVLLHNAIAAGADGYPFPTNLDRDQPIGGLVPDTQAELLWRAVSENWDPDQLRTALRDYAERHLTDSM